MLYENKGAVFCGLEKPLLAKHSEKTYLYLLCRGVLTLKNRFADV